MQLGITSDPFYKFIPDDSPPPAHQELEIYADDGGGLPSGGSGGGINGIICINGTPFSVVVQGSIGIEIT